MRAMVRRGGVVGGLAALLVSVALSVVTVAAPAGAATGVDVASWQHPGGAPIDWRAVRAAGHTFAYVKSTEATSYVNPWFAADWAGARNAGLLRGSYHYAKPALPLSTAVAQARYFVSVTGPMNGPTDLPPVLDLEETGGLAAGDVVAWARTWLEEVRRLTGRDPMIYLGYYFWKDTLQQTSALSGYRLWMPWYTSATQPGAVPWPWGGWTFWQFTETGSVPGIVGNADVNRFCCPDANLNALLGGSNAAAGNPFGNLDGVERIPGAVRLSGWAIDPDTTDPIDVHVYVDGKLGGVVKAGASRPDVGKAWPGWGNAHGIAADVPVGPGPHQVCAFAINTRSGTTNPLLGCRTVVGNPLGSLDTARSPEPGAIDVTGWAVDPDAAGASEVHLYVDGVFAKAVSTGQPRPDVDAALQLTQPANTGFGARIAGVPAGRRQVCAWAINVASGSGNVPIGCRSLDVLGPNPIGSLDGVTAGIGSLTVQGWALDPSTTGAVDVHVYVDGRFAGVAPTDQPRPDVAGLYPEYGPNRGYRLRIDKVGGGPHQVCAFAINVGAGTTNPVLGCRTVQSPGDPVGSIDAVSTAGSLQVAGWALDPDTTAPVDVRLFVDGELRQTVPAGQSRPDIATAFPGYGSGHGFAATLTGVGDGTHEVCAVAVDVGPGADRTIGCRTFPVTGTPKGSFDAASRPSATTARLTGWALDPDTSSPIDVRIAVDGTVVGTAAAAVSRPDVGAAFPASGPNHGFVVDVPVAVGPRQVCVFAVNIGAGTLDPLLGCRTV